MRAGLGALRQAILHPITLPIILGLAWGQTGWSIPPILDRPLQWLGQAFSPIALLMVGITLAHIVGRGQAHSASGAPGTEARDREPGDRTLLFWRAAGFTCLKNTLHPLLAGGLCALFGLSGLPVAVSIVAAALPIGATVLMFAQRYQIARDQVTTAIAVSTFAALATLPIALTIGRSLL
jgi:predicted permease